MDDALGASSAEPDGPSDAAASDPQQLGRLLLYGRPATRRRLAAQLLADGDPKTWRLLAETVRSDPSWRLRARCLEVLGLAVGGADQRTTEYVLNRLLGEPVN